MTGLGVTVVSMALIHPNQQDHFNFFVDRATPEHLRAQYAMDNWGNAARQGLEWILQSRAGDVSISGGWRFRNQLVILPDTVRDRLQWNPTLDALFGRPGYVEPSDRALHRVKVYGNTLWVIERREGFRAVYEATRGREPIADSAYDVYQIENALALVMEPCAPSFIRNGKIYARITPVDRSDLLHRLQDRGFELWRFYLPWLMAYFNGKCVGSIPTPGFPIAEIEIISDPELMSEEEGRELARRAREEGQSLARSAYDLYLFGGELIYIRQTCDPIETESRFYLDVVPAGASPHEQGAVITTAFDFHRRGAFVDGACLARAALSERPITWIRTGQRGEGGELWSAAFSLNPERYRAVYESALQREPVARGAFDVHAADGALVYVRERCEPADTEARFFLHVVPERAEDLPEDALGAGFENRDFDFYSKGALFEGKCAARVPLPGYAIAGIRTGQRGEGGESWRAAFSLSPERYRAVYESALLIEPVARGAFDVHAADGALVYVRERCEPADTEARFFLHVVPERAEDLPEDALGAGFENRDFDFYSKGALFEGKCAARVPLPGYAIAGVRTGQRGEGGESWRAEFSLSFRRGAQGDEG